MRGAPWPFSLLRDDVAIGTPLPPGWQPLRSLPVAIFVGVTGVGKSTTVQLLANLLPHYRLLPERRWLTDRCIIAPLAGERRGAGGAPDRLERLAYTRRFRERYPGGMAFILANLAVPEGSTGTLLFDGLRGADEVAFAAQALREARFIVLDAPDAIRIARLVSRQDTFDSVSSADIAALSESEQDELCSLASRYNLNADEVIAKVRIVEAERRNYDSKAAAQTLERWAPQRTLLFDTTEQPATAIAQQICRWLSETSPDCRV